jgi:hypothetical protein
VQPVRAREPQPSLQLAQTLVGRGDLDTADAVPGRLPVHRERRVQRDGILRDPAHHPGRVRLKREPGRVRGRSARLEQRTLIEDENVRSAELGKVERGARPDDAGADDDGLRAIRDHGRDALGPRLGRQIGG